MAYSVGFYNPSFTEDVFDALERNFAHHYGTSKQRAFFPGVDVAETADAYVLDMDLPGLKEEDVEINLQDQVLSISASAKLENAKESDKADKTRYLIHERTDKVFTRRFTLPLDIDAANIKARFEDGVLHIDIVRRPETKPQKIAIMRK